MGKRSITKTVASTETVTDRYRGSLPVLVLATPQQIKLRDYDGLSNFDQRKPLQPVKIFGPRHLIAGTDQHRLVRRSVGKRWDVFVAALQLRDAHKKKNEYEIGVACRKLLAAKFEENPSEGHRTIAADSAGFWSTPMWSASAAPVNLPPAITHELESARLVFWWDVRQKRFIPAIFCKDYGTAMFVRGVLGDLRACPECNKAFIPDRVDQEYHDSHCRDRHRMRRFRAKSKSKIERTGNF